MVSLNFADMIVTFLAILGPQKVRLAFARIASVLDNRSLRLVAAITAIAAALVDAACAAIFTPLLRRAHESILEVFSRLLGILLAAVGVQLFLDGLSTLGVLGKH